MYAYTCMVVCVHTCIYMYGSVCTYMHMHMHMHVCVLLLLLLRFLLLLLLMIVMMILALIHTLSSSPASDGSVRAYMHIHMVVCVHTCIW